MIRRPVFLLLFTSGIVTDAMLLQPVILHYPARLSETLPPN